MAYKFGATTAHRLVGTSTNEYGVGTSGTAATVCVWQYQYANATFLCWLELIGNTGGLIDGWHTPWDSPRTTSLRMTTSGGAPTLKTNVTECPLNEWHHLSWEWDGTDVRLYVDGVYKRSAGLTGTMKPLGNSSGLGNRPGGTHSAEAHYADFCVFDRTLTDAERNAIVAGGSPGQFDPTHYTRLSGHGTSEAAVGADPMTWTVTGATYAADPPRAPGPRRRPKVTAPAAAAATTPHRLMTLGVGM